MLVISDGGHILEILIINVLNYFSTVGYIEYYKLLFCERLEDTGQLNQELFIAVSGIINPLEVISDLEAAISDILTRKFHQLYGFEISLHMFYMVKGHHGN